MATETTYFSALKEATRNLFRKPNTSMFPLEHVEVPPDIRGAPTLQPENCTLCMKCQRICPTNAIIINKTSKTEADFSIDLGVCCYCQECEDACNFGAINLEPIWLTSDMTRDNLIKMDHVTKQK